MNKEQQNFDFGNLRISRRTMLTLVAGGLVIVGSGIGIATRLGSSNPPQDSEQARLAAEQAVKEMDISNFTKMLDKYFNWDKIPGNFIKDAADLSKYGSDLGSHVIVHSPSADKENEKYQFWFAKQDKEKGLRSDVSIEMAGSSKVVNFTPFPNGQFTKRGPEIKEITEKSDLVQSIVYARSMEEILKKMLKEPPVSWLYIDYNVVSMPVQEKTVISECPTKSNDIVYSMLVDKSFNIVDSSNS